MEREVTDLVIARHIYLVVGQLVTDREEIRSPGDYHFWSIRNYAFMVSVSVRRLMDHDRRSLSMHRLLQEIAANDWALSRASHVALYPKFLRPAAHSGFERYAGRGAGHYPGRRALIDDRKLKNAQRKIRSAVNKRLAHLELRTRDRSMPTMKELHDAIDLLQVVILKYQFLLNARGETDLLPTWQFDWTEIFRVPWKLDRTWLAH